MGFAPFPPASAARHRPAGRRRPRPVPGRRRRATARRPSALPPALCPSVGRTGFPQTDPTGLPWHMEHMDRLTGTCRGREPSTRAAAPGVGGHGAAAGGDGPRRRRLGPRRPSSAVTAAPAGDGRSTTARGGGRAPGFAAGAAASSCHRDIGTGRRAGRRQGTCRRPPHPPTRSQGLVGRSPRTARPPPGPAGGGLAARSRGRLDDAYAPSPGSAAASAASPPSWARMAGSVAAHTWGARARMASPTARRWAAVSPLRSTTPFIARDMSLT